MRHGWDYVPAVQSGLNESPSEKEGKCQIERLDDEPEERLNESPSEKEGKSNQHQGNPRNSGASMKVPPKRKGNNKP